ncbi:MAG: ArsR/SmtB family transcription factor [Sphaerochaeta sp.]
MNRLNDFLKLAANEDRFRMLVLLFQENLCVCHISGILEMSQPTASKNLAKFRDTKFVETRQEGKYIYYSFKSDDERVDNFLSDVVKNVDNYPKLKEDKSKLANKDIYMVSCSCANK